jgi:hypothetical protein
MRTPRPACCAQPAAMAGTSSSTSLATRTGPRGTASGSRRWRSPPACRRSGCTTRGTRAGRYAPSGHANGGHQQVARTCDTGVHDEDVRALAGRGADRGRGHTGGRHHRAGCSRCEKSVRFNEVDDLHNRWAIVELDPPTCIALVERATGIEPAQSVWKTETLPLSYARAAGLIGPAAPPHYTVSAVSRTQDRARPEDQLTSEWPASGGRRLAKIDRRR